MGVLCSIWLCILAARSLDCAGSHDYTRTRSIVHVTSIMRRSDRLDRAPLQVAAPPSPNVNCWVCWQPPAPQDATPCCAPPNSCCTHTHRNYIQFLLGVTAAAPLLVSHAIQALESGTSRLCCNLSDCQGEGLEQQGQAWLCRQVASGITDF